MKRPHSKNDWHTYPFNPADFHAWKHSQDNTPAPRICGARSTYEAENTEQTTPENGHEEEKYISNTP